MTKLFFAINAVVWIGYALVCIFYPQMLADLGVFDQSSWVEKVEVRSMYGGAQLAIGLFALCTLLNLRKHVSTSLLFFLLLFGGLAFVRMAGLVIDGPGLEVSVGSFSAKHYNSGALWFFELPMFVYALILVVVNHATR